MNTEEKNRIGYVERDGISGDKKHCSTCVYAFTQMFDPDDRPCRMHNMVVGANDKCDYFEDWTEVTEEGRKWAKSFDNLARSIARAKGIPYPDEVKEENKRSVQKPNEEYMTTGQFVAIGSLLGGTLFNLMMAASVMEWKIKEWFFTYVVAIIIVGIGDFLLGVLSKEA